jgi:hypothetical protein
MPQAASDRFGRRQLSLVTSNPDRTLAPTFGPNLLLVSAVLRDEPVAAQRKRLPAG